MKLKELYAGPENWTQRSCALNSENVAVPTFHATACKWCLFGGIRKCYPSEGQQIISLIEKHLKQNHIEWNDSPERKFEDVKTLVEVLDI